MESLLAGWASFGREEGQSRRFEISDHPAPTTSAAQAHRTQDDEINCQSQFPSLLSGFTLLRFTHARAYTYVGEAAGIAYESTPEKRQL